MAIQYKLYVSKDNFSTHVSGLDGLIVNTNFYDLGDVLEPNTEYKYRVKALVNGVESNFSDPVTVTTNAFVVPTVLTASDITDNSFTANWEAVDDIRVIQYYLDVSEDNFSTFVSGYENKLVIGTSNSVTGLSSNTEYKYRVRAFYSTVDYGFSSGNSLSETVITDVGVSVPDTPTGLSIDSYDNTSAVISWDSVIDADTYNLYVYNVDDSLYLNSIGSTSASPIIYDSTASTTLSPNNLSENTEYRFYISAENEIGESSLSSAVTIFTMKEVISYASNKNTRRYIYLSDYSKSFDERVGVQTSYAECENQNLLSISSSKILIAYTGSVVAGKRQVFVKNLETNVITNITNDNANDYGYPVFKPNDNEYVYCVANPATPASILYRINVNTLVKDNLRNISTTGFYNISFSPDGSLLVFQYGGSSWNIGTLNSSDLNGSITNLVNTGSVGVVAGNPIFNNTGDKIAYTRQVSGTFQLFDMDINGSNQIQRSSGANPKTNPIYSLSNDKILFRFTSGSDLFIYECDNTYDGITGYFENQTTWLNNSGNLSEFPLCWDLVQLRY